MSSPWNPQSLEGILSGMPGGGLKLSGMWLILFKTLENTIGNS